MTAVKPATDRLVNEALAKSGLLWVTSPAGSAPVWHVNLAGVAYTVSGPGEQFSPEHVGRVEVVARSKETRARLVSFEADAEVVTPQDEAWEAATFALKAGRLNAPAHDIVARWADECRVTRYTPDLSTVVLRGELLDPPPVAADDSADDEAPGSATSTSTSPSTSTPTPGRGTNRAAREEPAKASKTTSPPEADLGTDAPGESRPAAAAAEREHRATVRAEKAGATAVSPASSETDPSQTPASSPESSPPSSTQAPSEPVETSQPGTAADDQPDAARVKP